jgi:hypothetical protein
MSKLVGAELGNGSGEFETWLDLDRSNWSLEWMRSRGTFYTWLRTTKSALHSI